MNRTDQYPRLSGHAVVAALLSWALMASPVCGFAQEPSSDTPVFKSNVNVVNLLATVRDKKGQIVPNLTKDDFVLQVDGKPANVRYFAKESNLPLTLGLLVDTSLSQRNVLEEERTASYEFLRDVMREDRDMAFVIQFDYESELLQDLTNSKQKLEVALDRVHAAQPDQNAGNQGGGQYPGGGQGGGYPGGGYPGGGYPGGGYPGRRYPGSGGGGGYPGGGRNGGGGYPSAHHRGGTMLYDAVFLAADELMRKQQGRKALILLTDGVDQGSKVSLDRAIETAERADTMVYSILFSDPSAYYGGRHVTWGGPMGGGGSAPHADGKQVLQRMSKQTGGRFFEVSKKQSVAEIYKQIQEELRNQYNLGFSPEKTADSGDYHRITLTTKEKDLIVQTREGYYDKQQARVEGQ